MSAEFFPRWERDGFSAPPETFMAGGSELILRAYSPSPANPDFQHGTSRLVGNCFFVPACGHRSGPAAKFSIEREKWTGAFLEEGLNAFFWGNAYDRIAVWALNPGTNYNIGPIGQDTRFDAGDYRGIGRYLPWPGGNRNYFRQVTLNLPPGTNGKNRDRVILSLIRRVDDFRVVQPLSRHAGTA